MDPVGRKTRRLTDGFLGIELDVGQMQVPIVSSLVDDRSQKLAYSLIHPLNASVTLGMA